MMVTALDIELLLKHWVTNLWVSNTRTKICHCIADISLACGVQFSLKPFVDLLIGDKPTPLKNMSSSVGMMKFPIY